MSIQRWNDVEATFSTSFKRRISVMCLQGWLLRNSFWLWTVIMLLLWLTHFTLMFAFYYPWQRKKCRNGALSWNGLKSSLLNRVPRVPKYPIPKCPFKCPNTQVPWVPKRPSSAREPQVLDWTSALSAQVPFECLSSIQVLSECPLYVLQVNKV